MSTRVPNPLIPGTQWTRGEPLDDLKLHNRVDLPLEELGGIQRTFNTDLAAFYGTLSPSIGIAANTNIPWVGVLDTVNGFASPYYTVDTAGLYLVAVNLAYATATAGDCTILRQNSTDAAAPISHRGAVVVNGGPRIGYVLDLNANESLSVQSTVAFTVAAAGVNWFFVQQLTWA